MDADTLFYLMISVFMRIFQNFMSLRCTVSHSRPHCISITVLRLFFR